MANEYGILGPTQGAGLLPWSWAARRLADSRGHWLATTRPNGSPHVMIVWGVWLDEGFYFATSQRSRKARNLTANSRCVICTERMDEAVILEGVAGQITDPSAIRRFEDAYRTKYGEEADTDKFPLYVVRPRTAFGFISTAEQWAGTATRWTFRP